MAKKTALLSSYCSAQESAYAAAHPESRFAATVQELQKALDLVNAKPGPGRPDSRACGQLLSAVILAKEDAYWGVAQTINAMPVAA